MRRSNSSIICALADWLINKLPITGKRMVTEEGSHKRTSWCGWKMRGISEERLKMVVWRLQCVASERLSFLSLKEPWNFGLRVVRLGCTWSLGYSLLWRWRDWGRHWIFQLMPSGSVMAGLMSSRGVMLCNIISIMGKLAQSILPMSRRSTSGCSTRFSAGWNKSGGTVVVDRGWADLSKKWHESLRDHKWMMMLTIEADHGLLDLELMNHVVWLYILSSAGVSSLKML